MKVEGQLEQECNESKHARTAPLKWKHAFCQPHTTHLCHPRTAEECSRHGVCSYEDPEAPSSCTKATLLD